jgi:hypothetical protein
MFRSEVATSTFNLSHHRFPTAATTVIRVTPAAHNRVQNTHRQAPLQRRSGADGLASHDLSRMT